MADGVWKEVESKVNVRSDKLLLNKFFDLSTPMRKGRGWENRKKHNGRNGGHYNAAARAKIKMYR